MNRITAAIATVLAASAIQCAQAADSSAKTPSMDEILAASRPAEWRELDPQNTLYMQLPAGRVVIELAPRFAPRLVANIKTLVHSGFFDGLSVSRVQDGYVTQWGDAEQVQKFGTAARSIAPEFEVKDGSALPFDALPDHDGYARQSGFVESFPVGRDGPHGAAWLAHCYGMVGAGRDNDPASGNGAELYAVIGQSPRQLDRNIALVGRVVQGMEFLTSLPRGHDTMGFYKDSEMRTAIVSMRLAADVPASERTPLEVLRSDSASFRTLVAARRNRHDDWYLRPAGHIDLCNVPIPVRAVPRSAPAS
ncbi:MAG: peptidylprolyl isomerase [Steroidobacteraceae bacterium]